MKKFQIGDQVQVTKKCISEDYDVSDYNPVYGIITDVSEETEEKIIEFTGEDAVKYFPQLGERIQVETGETTYSIYPFGEEANQYKNWIDYHDFYSSDLKLIYRPKYIQ